jgi:hypothetical protein
MTVKQLSDGNADGTMIGQDENDKVGFFGKTPVVRQAAIASGADTTTEFTAAIDSIIMTLRAYGLIPNGDT